MIPDWLEPVACSVQGRTIVFIEDASSVEPAAVWLMISACSETACAVCFAMTRTCSPDRSVSDRVTVRVPPSASRTSARPSTLRRPAAFESLWWHPGRRATVTPTVAP